MKFRHFLIGAFALASATCMYAQESNYLHVRTADGVAIYDIEEVSRISFTADKMQIAMKNDKPEVSINRTELQSMAMDESSSSVNTIEADATSILRYDSASRTATVAQDCTFEIFSTAGELLYAVADVKAGEKISMAGIHPGIVIIKAGNNSLKIALK